MTFRLQIILFIALIQIAFNDKSNVKKTQEKVPSCRLSVDDTGEIPLLDQYKEDNYPVVCTEDINKDDGRVDNRRRCYSDGYSHVAILLPLKEKCHNISRGNHATQTSRGHGSDQQERYLSHTCRSDIEKLGYAPHRRSFVVRHWCVIVAVLFVIVFIMALSLIVGIVMDKAHKDRQHKLLQNSNHSDEMFFIEADHVECKSFNTHFDKSQYNADSVSEFTLPWKVQENPSTDSNIKIKQLDNKNIQVQRSDWYMIACLIIIDALSTKQTNSVHPSATTVCITIDPQNHQPVCNKVSMATRSVIPVQVSSRIFLRSGDIIRIVVHTSSKNMIQRGHLQIHADPC